MSSINLDLDFQDYAPTSGSNNNNRASTSMQSGTLTDTSTSGDASSYLKQTNQKSSVLQAIQNRSRASTNQLPNVLTEEAIQQAILMSARLKNKQSRSIFSEWGLGFLAQYFDVTTNDVVRRILWSNIPLRRSGIDLDYLNNQDMTAPLTVNIDSEPHISNQDGAGDQTSPAIHDDSGFKQKRYSYIERFIQSRPDLYGPFWISITLIFAVALFSNIANFKKYQIRMNQLDSTTLQESSPEWHYSMDELNKATSVVLFYVTLVPTFLWFLFWFRGCAQYYTLIETICAYGYCLSLFIPLTILLTVQVSIFRYLSIGLLSAPSTIVLIMSFLPVIKSDPNKAGSQLALIMIPVCQLGLAYILHRIMLQ